MNADRLALVVVAWIATYLIHSTLLLGAAWAVSRRLPPRFDRVAELCWKVALVGALISASAQPAVGVDPLRWRLHLGAPTSENAASGAAPLTGSPHRLISGGIVPSWPLLLVSLWLIGAAAGVSRVAVAHRRLRRALEGAHPLDPDLHRALVERTGVGGEVMVQVSHAIQSPVVWAGKVWLPSRVVRSLSLDQLTCVFAHELAHLRRRDALWRWMGALVERVFFMQPLTRLATLRLRELAECLCDDFAVERTGTPVMLASALATVATLMQSVRRDDRIALAPTMLTNGQESLVVRRVRRILGPARPRTVCVSALTQILVGAVGCATLTLVAPRVRGQADATTALVLPVYTITAVDPAGKFTVVLHGPRVIGATIDGRAVPHDRIDQRGSALRLIEEDGSAFSIELTPQGGMHWQPRRPRAVPELLAT